MNIPTGAKEGERTPNFHVENEQGHFFVTKSPHEMREVQKSSDKEYKTYKMPYNGHYAAGKRERTRKKAKNLMKMFKTGH